MEEIDVGAATDFTHGMLRVVKIGSREVVVVRWHDSFYALRNVCPHQLSKLNAGIVRARLDSSSPGTLRVADRDPVIVCPWHHWEYDLASGECIDSGGSGGWLGIRPFPVRVSGGRVLVRTS